MSATKEDIGCADITQTDITDIRRTFLDWTFRLEGKAQENRTTYVILKGTESERMEQSRCVCLWAQIKENL